MAVGIDLGTTFSAVAHADARGQVTLLPNDRGSTLTPSVVAFRGDTPLVGESAKELQEAGQPVAAFFKRQMGQPYWTFQAGAREYTPVELSALVLGQLKQDAERALGGPVKEAVITVPAYFRDAERRATIAAGRRAGLDVLQVINEPTAAAIAYGLRGSSEQTVLVYDLGGGTFDVSLLRLEGRETRVLSSEGDHELGGKDWDDRILTFLARRFLDEFGSDPLDERGTVGDLLVQAENAKRRLSSTLSTRISIVHGGHRGNYELDRAAFEALTADLMERTIALTRKVLDENELGPRDLHGVVLVGGSTRMPMVREFVTRAFGKPPLTGVNADEAVATGAALVAQAYDASPARLGGKTAALQLAGGRRVVDVTSHSLGMIAVNESRSAFVNTVIVPKDRQLPCRESRPYKHRGRRNESSRMEVFVTQGESESPQDVTYLGLHVIHDVPPSPTGAHVVDVEYGYDASGVVHVAAKLRSTGQALRVSVESLPPDVPARFLLCPDQDGQRSHVTAYLAFDLSGSMNGAPIREAQRAALEFLKNTDLSHCSLGIVGFSDRVLTKIEASQNARKLEKAIGALRVGETGGGNRTDPFRELEALLRKPEGPRFAIVLADGVWADQDAAVRRAGACKERGIDVIAIGFGGADEAFLRRLASSDEASFFTSLEGLVDTFSTIAQTLTEHDAAGSDRSAAASKPRRGGILSLFSRW